MSWRWWKRLGCLVVLLAIALPSPWVIHWLRWRERSDPATGVAVELRPAQQTVKVGETPAFSVALVNRGDRDVVLVEPGDGSECGWRTPLIEWSGDYWPPGGRCGNINALRPEEVFTLKPGESRQLPEWVGVPPFDRPGRYRLSVRYTNAPNLRWSGIPLGRHDEGALEAVRRSTEVSAVSNPVELVVTE